MTTEAQKRVIDKAKRSLINLLEIPSDKVASNPRHGTATLAELEVEIDSTFQVARELQSMDLEDVPPLLLQELMERADGMHQVFDGISNLETRQRDFHTRRNGLIKELKERVGPFHQIAMTVLLIATRHLFDVSRVIGELRGKIDAQLDEVKEVKRSVVDREAEADKVLERVRQTERDAKSAAKLLTVAKYSDLFRKYARKHAIWAVAWLFVTVATFGGVAYFVYSHFVESDAEAEQAAQQLPEQTTPEDAGISEQQIARISLSVLGLLFAAWAAKNYRAHRHLATIASHRFAALNTFEIFVKEAGDAQTKDFVLLEASRCIFGHLPTGYLAGDSDGSDGRVVEIIKLARGGVP